MPSQSIRWGWPRLFGRLHCQLGSASGSPTPRGQFSFSAGALFHASVDQTIPKWCTKTVSQDQLDKLVFLFVLNIAEQPKDKNGESGGLVVGRCCSCKMALLSHFFSVDIWFNFELIVHFPPHLRISKPPSIFIFQHSPQLWKNKSKLQPVSSFLDLRPHSTKALRTWPLWRMRWFGLNITDWPVVSMQSVLTKSHEKCSNVPSVSTLFALAHEVEATCQRPKTTLSVQKCRKKRPQTTTNDFFDTASI